MAESFEHIHRPSLASMGMIPLEFTGGETGKFLGRHRRGDGLDLRA